MWTVPPYVPAVVLTGELVSSRVDHVIYLHPVVVSVLSDRLKWRGPFILIFLPLTIIGMVVRYWWIRH